MALKYLAALLALILSVSSFDGQQCNSNNAATAIKACTNSASDICEAKGIMERVQNCDQICTSAALDNSNVLDSFIQEFKSKQGAAGCKNERACNIGDGLKCALGVAAFVAALPVLATVDINDAPVVCGYVNQFSYTLADCASLTAGCVALAGEPVAGTTATVDGIIQYTLKATGQSCVCVSSATALVKEINTLYTATPAMVAGDTDCTGIQAKLSSYIDASIACTAALPANPVPSIPVLSVDFRAAGTTVIQAGSAQASAACNLQYVPSKASAAEPVSIILLLASLLTVQYLRK